MNIGYLLGTLLYPEYTWRRKHADKVVYLTFDDGPHPEITPWVLDLLHFYRFSATFFMVGDNVKLYPHIVERVIEEGHAVGNHTQHHIKGWKTDALEYLEDIKRCEELLPKTNLFRPPYGQMNRKARKLLLDYEVVMWDILSKDYLKGLNCAGRLNKMKSMTKPGSIIVFHDSLKARKNLEQLFPAYLEFLKDKEYKSLAL